jgi:hypothetical protein
MKFSGSGDRPPLLQLSEAEIAKERSSCGPGMPEGAWFARVHSREGGFKPVHDWAHSFRNSRIDGYRGDAEIVTAEAGASGWRRDRSRLRRPQDCRLCAVACEKRVDIFPRAMPLCARQYLWRFHNLDFWRGRRSLIWSDWAIHFFRAI